MNALAKLENANGIAELTSAEQLLEKVQTLPEARDLIASAEALRIFMRKANIGYSAQNRAAAIAIKARRKAGEMMKGIERNAGGRPNKTTKGALAVSDLKTARDELNVSEPTANKWQRLADETTEEEIDEQAAKYTAAQMELTTDACLKQTQDEKDRQLLSMAGEKLGPIIRHPAAGVMSLFDRAAEAIAKLPPAVECVRTLPEELRHAVSIKNYRQTVRWMNDFCDEWESMESKK